jgi:hypothetical protein
MTTLEEVRYEYILDHLGSLEQLGLVRLDGLCSASYHITGNALHPLCKGARTCRCSHLRSDHDKPGTGFSWDCSPLLSYRGIMAMRADICKTSKPGRTLPANLSHACWSSGFRVTRSSLLISATTAWSSRSEGASSSQ